MTYLVIVTSVINKVVKTDHCNKLLNGMSVNSVIKIITYTGIRKLFLLTV